jgi:hypothetical protein
MENGYIEGPLDHNLSILNNQLELLSINNSNLFIKNSYNITEPSIYENTLLDNHAKNDSINNKHL